MHKDECRSQAVTQQASTNSSQLLCLNCLKRRTTSLIESNSALGIGHLLVLLAIARIFTNSLPPSADLPPRRI